MAYTDKFLKLPTRMWDSKTEKFSGKKHIVRIDPDEITWYYPSGELGDEDFDKTKIETRAGEGPLIFLPILEFEEKLNTFVANRHS